VTNYGAKIEQVLVPGRDGSFDDVVLGYDSIEGVVGGSPSVGAFIGRYAGRIENARFTWAAWNTSWPPTTARTACTAA
jgi:aldose 1-epimerase